MPGLISRKLCGFLLILSINPSANVFVFGDFNVHHKDWPTYSGGTNRPGELCSNFSSRSFGFIYFLMLVLHCSTVAFPPLGNSDCVVVTVSIDFPSNSQRDAPFHHITYHHSCADWDGLCDHLKNVPRKDIF